MPPRTPGLRSLGTLNGMNSLHCKDTSLGWLENRMLTRGPVCLRPLTKPLLPLLPVVQRAGLRMSKKEKARFAKRQPDKWAQMQQRLKANVARQEAAIAVREKGWGDHVHGIPTPYVESFDSVGQDEGVSQYGDGSQPLPTSKDRLNHFMTRSELDDALQHAFDMTKPQESQQAEGATDQTLSERIQKHSSLHAYRSEVINRLMSLDMASGKLKRHTNIKRIVADLGRHNTDDKLVPMPPSITPNTVPKAGRSGPDTGSSEVQIGILTLKIRKLSQMLEGPKGYKDHYAKRDLRLLCHRRQRLLRYMERKERGSERWQNMLKTLGLTPATWKEQLTM
jgi:ribosomal protein S15